MKKVVVKNGRAVLCTLRRSIGERVIRILQAAACGDYDRMAIDDLVDVVGESVLMTFSAEADKRVLSSLLITASAAFTGHEFFCQKLGYFRQTEELEAVIQIADQIELLYEWLEASPLNELAALADG